MKSHRIHPLIIHDWKQNLLKVRKASLQATRDGDFLKVARLTWQAGRLNKAIMRAEGQIEIDI
jgi:hypothetical protein